ncbi:hypothetical protein FHS19_002921 [Paenibacillus rhizosphaerae]|uniref:Lipoprotein n=1 Tax=Paenibacillus rhizosphaerae TaxID=297318 RepID=A0A839TUA1_9BACL|nr:hypothetical protein [Paenibacillus rhizosphaerae]MBB3128267.1 hypothetical protein [Paenibacillus rhizosphaerae]
MKRSVMLLVLILAYMSLFGCSSTLTNGKDVVVEKQSPSRKPESEPVRKPDLKKPPEADILIGEGVYPTKLGTYCWTSTNQSICVDTVGPVELLKDEVPVSVQPGEVVKLVMNVEPKPNKYHVTQMTAEGTPKEVSVIENSFRAPTDKGTYYYAYGVWWMDEHKENQSNGDAFYCFVLKVI